MLFKQRYAIFKLSNHSFHINLLGVLCACVMIKYRQNISLRNSQCKIKDRQWTINYYLMNFLREYSSML